MQQHLGLSLSHVPHLLDLSLLSYAHFLTLKVLQSHSLFKQPTLRPGLLTVEGFEQLMQRSASEKESQPDNHRKRDSEFPLIVPDNVACQEPQSALYLAEQLLCHISNIKVFIVFLLDKHDNALKYEQKIHTV